MNKCPSCSSGVIDDDFGIGMPLPPLFDPMDEALWWANFASIDERKAVLVAAFRSLPERDRHAFLASAQRRSGQ
jgi:hypothetical protein